MSSFPFQLIMRAGPMPGKVFPLQKNEIYIGRDPSNDIAISDVEVSRKHARLTMQPNGFILEDLGSTNGTYVNGQRLLGPHILRAGEVIQLGENVSLSFDALYDENATLVAPVNIPPAYNPPPQPYSAPPTSYVPPPIAASMPQYGAPIKAAPPPQTSAPVYSMPAGENQEENLPPQPAKKKNSSAIFAGCGCLLLILIFIVGLIIFDQLNLWCVGPFRVLSPIYELISGGVCP
jgi:hypothetical protein